jgi:hypothetical protein
MVVRKKELNYIYIYIYIKKLSWFQTGPRPVLCFHPDELFSFQSTGTLIAVSRYAGATFCPPSVFSRGIGWQVIK